MKAIMIIDDEQPFHDFFSEMLDGTDYEVIRACDGEEALFKFEEKRPELIITRSNFLRHNFKQNDR